MHVPATLLAALVSKAFDCDLVRVAGGRLKISSQVNDAKAARTETTSEMKAIVADARVEQAGKMVDIAGRRDGLVC